METPSVNIFQIGQKWFIEKGFPGNRQIKAAQNRLHEGEKRITLKG
jgi:hypothetical protein